MEIIKFLDHDREYICDYINVEYHWQEYLNYNYDFNDEIDLLKYKLLKQPLEIRNEIDSTFTEIVKKRVMLDLLCEMVVDLTYQLQ